MRIGETLITRGIILVDATIIAGVLLGLSSIMIGVLFGLDTFALWKIGTIMSIGGLTFVLIALLCRHAYELMKEIY